MTRIPMVSEAAGLTDAQRAVWTELVSSRGGVRGPFGVLLHRPEIAAPIQALGAYLRFGATLPAAVRESVILTTARHWDNPHEWDMHRPIAVGVGVSLETVALIEAQAFDEVDGEVGVAVRLAAALLAEGRVLDELFAPAAATWTPDELVELVSLVGYYTFQALAMNAFEVPSAGRSATTA